MSAIREIQAKTLLTTVKNPADWFGVRYNMNIYRGCEHHCIYCDSRSECYQIENFDGEVLVKVNAVELLEKELSHKRIKGTVGSGSMSDPYTVAEKRYNLTGRSLEAIARYNPRTGQYATPDGKVYRQSDLVTPAGARSWKDLFPT